MIIHHKIIDMHESRRGPVGIIGLSVSRSISQFLSQLKDCEKKRADTGTVWGQVFIGINGQTLMFTLNRPLSRRGGYRQVFQSRTIRELQDQMETSIAAISLVHPGRKIRMTWGQINVRLSNRMELVCLLAEDNRGKRKLRRSSIPPLDYEITVSQNSRLRSVVKKNVQGFSSYLNSVLGDPRYHNGNIQLLDGTPFYVRLTGANYRWVFDERYAADVVSYLQRKGFRL